MRVVHIVPSLEERHGGPSKSVRALANAQAAAGATVDLLATAAPDSAAPVPGADVAGVRLFPREAPRWLCRAPALARHLAAAPGDVLHHHALWLLTLRYAAAAALGSGAPLVLAPRGMLSGWAYEHRRWRKRLAELFVHPGAFARAAGWHATSQDEADDIRKLGFRQPVCVAPNGVDLPAAHDLAAARAHWLAAAPRLAGRSVALFYSRLHRKKRLRELVDLWLDAPRGDWHLLVAGVPEEYTVAEVEGWIAARGGTDRVSVFDGTGHPFPYAVASLFLLPSHSENFGLVIAEALAAGVPALVTDTTPWRPLAEHGAGECVAWPDFAPALDRLLRLPATELAAQGARGRAWMAEEFSWDRAGRLLLEFYRSLPHGRR